MLFNSFEFGLFLPAVFLLYWYGTRGNRQVQNYLLIAASYFFYGWWDWRFLTLIVFSSAVDCLVGRGLAVARAPGQRRGLLLVSLVVNVGLLGFFKYYGFFVDSMATLLASVGLNPNPSSLSVILPVGISFYTFQTLSYSIDVYRRRIEPTRDPVAFFAYVSFFPQLVAGPIERAGTLLPQFLNSRAFSYPVAVDGCRQILWGLVKKVVIADSLAPQVDVIFSNYSELSTVTLALGAVCFAFQIYGDFSGYSDIAIGTARLFGFELMQNFAYPYFSRDIAEFWRRWHISLSTWFRDYVYIPMGGSRVDLGDQLRNVFVVFVVSGLWHGANWTFVIWGALNACYFLPLMVRRKNRRHLDTVADGSRLPSIVELGQITLTFTLVCVGWVFFRAPTLTDAWGYLVAGVANTTAPLGVGLGTILPVGGAFLLLIAEWIHRDELHPLAKPPSSSLARRGLYLGLALAVLVLGVDNQDAFIYFQF